MTTTVTPKHELIRGIGVVIDDHINSQDGDLISDLLSQIQEHNIPVLRYPSLPGDCELCHFGNISFILLDWELQSSMAPADSGVSGVVPLGDAFKQEQVKLNLDFIKKIKEQCFAPLFIFSHLAPEGIIDELRKAGCLSSPEDQSYIFVKSKNDLKRVSGGSESPLLTSIEKWISEHPSVYLLSKWNQSLIQTKNMLFWDLFNASPGWPGVLWETYKTDGDDPEDSLLEVVMRNMRSRMHRIGLSEPSILGTSKITDMTTLRNILESAMIIKQAQLAPNQYASGDIFRKTDENGKLLYRLNIRADCECMVRPGSFNKPEKIELYLLTGRVVEESEFKDEKIFNQTHGFAHRMSEIFLFPVDGGKCISFAFSDITKMSVKKLTDEHSERIGRITWPHITQIRQRYSLWLQRESLPKIPLESVLATSS